MSSRRRCQKWLWVDTSLAWMMSFKLASVSAAFGIWFFVFIRWEVAFSQQFFFASRLKSFCFTQWKNRLEGIISKLFCEKKQKKAKRKQTNKKKKHSDHTTTETGYIHFHFLPYNCCFVAWKEDLPRKLARFVLWYYISVPLNLLFVWVYSVFNR